MMQTPIGWTIAGSLFLCALALLYLRGWMRLRQMQPALASAPRLFALCLAVAALTGALIWPLPEWSSYMLTMRSVQKILLCMVVPPLLWLTCPYHILAWSLPSKLRRLASRAILADSPMHRTVRTGTQPMVAWLLFVSTFLFWHDPTIARFTLEINWLHYLAPWILLGTAVLYWAHVTATAPRIHRRLPAWLLIVYLIGVEIPNMIAGVTIAFSASPLYTSYIAIRSSVKMIDFPLFLTVQEDQMVGGAMIWVLGSLVYVTSIVAVLHHLFRQEDSLVPQPIAGWDRHENLVAPGLEHRAIQNRLDGIDLNHK